MFLKSARHSIQIKRGNFDFEFNVYELNTHQVPSTIENSILREFNNNSEIRSASFTPLFFQSLERILEIETKGRENFAKFRTLNPGKNLILKFDGNYPRFGKFLDLPGMASIAFYVTNLDTLKLDIANSEVTDAFFLELEESRYMIRFVRCGEVWVELIQRL